MLFKRLGKHVTARAIGNEIEIVGAPWIGDRLKRCPARIGDRRRRQALDDIGVERRLLLQIRLIDRAVGRLAVTTEQAVDDGRIRLQAHALLQPVVEDGRDMGALVILAGFLFDDRGKRHKFLNGLDRQIGIAPFPDHVDQLVLRSTHLIDDFLALGAAGEAVGIRAQAAFRRQGGRKFTIQNLVRGKAGKHLLDRQSLGQRHGIKDRFAGFEKEENILHRCAGLDLVFAGFQRLVLLQIAAGHQTENARVGDDVVTLQIVGDLDEARTIAHGKMGVGLERTRLLKRIDHVIEGHDSQHTDGDGKRHQEVQEDHKLAVGLARALGRCGHFFRPQGFRRGFRDDRAAIAFGRTVLSVWSLAVLVRVAHRRSFSVRRCQRFLRR
ncbi:hypothetical protein AT6N2_C1246 [Agrobacterium tumefaciens]|nr:hypothetical protein AT6N2_C1246 [Agrobacterium tumefaciens]